MEKAKPRLLVSRLNEAGMPVGDPVEVYGVSSLSITMGEKQPTDDNYYSYCTDYTVHVFLRNLPKEVQDLMVRNFDE